MKAMTPLPPWSKDDPQRNALIHVGFVDSPYDDLSMRSKYYSRDHFRIVDCSLIEYIGVEWSSRMPVAGHLPYMTEVFDRLARAGNDGAAESAFHLICQIYSHTELFRRSAELTPESGGKFDGHLCSTKMHPFYPSRKIREVLDAELRHELLEFICARFWMMPTERPETVGNTSIREGKHAFALLETRKAMVRACAKDWLGTPRDTNDELAFAMFCSMTNPWHGGCPTPEEKPAKDIKPFWDLVQQELRTAITEHAEMEQRRRGKEFDWKHWLTVDKRTAECRVVLETLAKTRAVIGGITGALADIEAHDRLKSFSHQVS